MSDQSANPFTTGETAQWTQEQWNAYVRSDAFVRRFTQRGLVDLQQLIQEVGMQGYLSLLEHCPHLVRLGSKIIDADTEDGKFMLEQIAKRGELPLPVLVKAGVITSNTADDMIQDALVVADEFLRTGKQAKYWTDEAVQRAMNWSPDQWEEALKYVDFIKNYTRGGWVNDKKLLEQMPVEVYNQMVERTPALVRIRDRVAVAETADGAAEIRKAVLTGDASLEAAIAAKVYSRKEAIAMHQKAADYAHQYLKPNFKWTKELQDSVQWWIPEQWDAFLDVPEFEVFIDNGVLNKHELKDLLGAQVFNDLVNKAHSLVEIGPRIVYAATKAGKEVLQTAFAKGDITVRDMYHSRLLTREQAEDLMRQAISTGKQYFREKREWDAAHIKEAMSWTADQWDAILDAVEFTETFVRDGVVNTKRLKGMLGDALYNRMVHQSAKLITIDDHVVDVSTSQGLDYAKEGLWTGYVTVQRGQELGLLTRKQAEQLIREAVDWATEYLKPDVKWTAEAVETAMNWSTDQWQAALEAVDFHQVFPRRGMLDRASMVVNMTPELFDRMVERVPEFVLAADNRVYDAATKEGYAALDQLGEV